MELKSNSKNTHRLTQNPLEARFLQLWENDHKYRNTLNYILADDPNQTVCVSEQDQVVAASVIQWLGSPVGQCFLEEVLSFDVRKQIPKKLVYNPLDND